MAIFYVDYENGNDSSAGTSFSTRKKTITSAVSAASAGDTIRLAKSPDPTSIGSGTIPNPEPNFCNTRSIGTINYSTTTGETVVTATNHYCATGDIVEIYNNSNGYNINGVFEVTYVSSSQIKLNGYTASTTTTGSGGRIRKITGKCIKLATAVTKDVASFATGVNRTAWTSSANVTTSLFTETGDFSSTRGHMQGGQSDQFVIADGFTTGKAAYYTLPSTLDLSGYQQLSLFIRQYSGTRVPAGNISIRLCSDTTGDTTVNTFTIPYPTQTSNNTNDPWIPITVDLGSNMGNSIQSVALYVDTDSGAQSFRICNILACKASSSADSLTLTSLVGRNGSLDDQKLWYGIQAIEGDGKIIVAGPMGRTNSPVTSYYYASHHAWFGDTGGTYTFYKRECFNTSVDNYASNTTAIVQNIAKSGTSGNKITISGGWDTSGSMTTQNGISFYDGVSGYGYGLHAYNYNHISIEKIGMVRYYSNFYIRNSDHFSVKDTWSVNHYYYGYYFRNNDYLEDYEAYVTGGGYSSVIYFYYNYSPKSGYNRKVYVASTYNNVQMQYNGSSSDPMVINELWSVYGTSDISLGYNYNIRFDTATVPEGTNYSNGGNLYIYRPNGPTGFGTVFVRNTYYGSSVYYADPNTVTFDSYTQEQQTINGYSNAQYSLRADSNSKVRVLSGTVDSRFYVYNGSELYTKGVTITGSNEYAISSGGRLYSRDHDGVSGDYLTAFEYGTLESETTTRHTASGLSWKADLTSSSAGYGNGVYWDVCKVAVEANSQLTTSIWIYRTGTGAHGGLKIDGGQIAGIGATSAYCMGSANTWEQVSLTATPTEDGILTIQAEAYYESSTSHDVYFDDFDVTQA